MQAGERLVGRIRLAYLDAVLRQDVSFFDVEARTAEVISTISTDTAVIQEALSEKVYHEILLSFFSFFFDRTLQLSDRKLLALFLYIHRRLHCGLWIRVARGSGHLSHHPSCYNGWRGFHLRAQQTLCCIANCLHPSWKRG